jgi:hypothetical protein
MFEALSLLNDLLFGQVPNRGERGLYASLLRLNLVFPS